MVGHVRGVAGRAAAKIRKERNVIKPYKIGQGRAMQLQLTGRAVSWARRSVGRTAAARAGARGVS